MRHRSGIAPVGSFPAIGGWVAMGELIIKREIAQASPGRVEWVVSGGGSERRVRTKSQVWMAVQEILRPQPQPYLNGYSVARMGGVG